MSCRSPRPLGSAPGYRSDTAVTREQHPARRASRRASSRRAPQTQRCTTQAESWQVRLKARERKSQVRPHLRSCSQRALTAWVLLFFNLQTIQQKQRFYCGFFRRLKCLLSQILFDIISTKKGFFLFFICGSEWMKLLMSASVDSQISAMGRNLPTWGFSSWGKHILRRVKHLRSDWLHIFSPLSMGSHFH